MKRERETGTRSGLWCGERLRPRRGEGERVRDRQQRLSYSLPAILGREKGQERRLGRERGLSPSDPGVRGAVRPDVLGVGPPLGGRRPGAEAPGFQISGLSPSLLRYPGISPHSPGIWDSGPSLSKPGSVFDRISSIWDSGPCVHHCPGFTPQAFRYRIQFAPVQIYGAQTPPSEIRDSATVALAEGEDWTARSDRVVTPSPPGEASRARPSGRATAEAEVARGKASLPLTLLGSAAGGARAEAEALGHHSDPYQARPYSQGPQGPPCQLGAGPGA